MNALTLVRSGRDDWRQRWGRVAESLNQTGKSADAEEARFIAKLLHEEQEAMEQDQAARRRFLVERKGSVAEVAAETGYTSAHLYGLIREDKLADVSEDGPAELRYSDVWALRGVPLEIQDFIADAAAGKATGTDGRRPTNIRPDKVRTTVISRTSK